MFESLTLLQVTSRYTLPYVSIAALLLWEPDENVENKIR